MVLVDPIPDVIDIIDSPPPDISVEATRSYIGEMGNASPEWYKAEVAAMFAGIDTWFETPAQTDHYAWQIVQDIKHNRVPGFGDNKPTDIQVIATDPRVQQYIFSRYIGRLNAANDARQQFMHHIMMTQIRALEYAVNHNATAMTNLHKQIIAYVDTHLAAERAKRAEIDAGIIKLFQAADRNVVTGVEQWTRDKIATPIVKAMGDQRTQITQETNLKIAGSKNEILGDLLPTLGALIAGQNMLSRVVTNLQTESDECVKPMCSTMGPKSPLGSLLKGIDFAKWIALFALLENMTIADLERLAVTIGGLAGGVGDAITQYVLDVLAAEHP